MNFAPDFEDREVITLTRNGIWLADGEEIQHEPTRRLFARSLRRRADGVFLEIGRETKRIEIEDTLYFVVRIDRASDGGLILTLNDETREPLRPESLHYLPGRLVCRVKEGTEEAKFLQVPYMELLDQLEEDETSYRITLSGRSFILQKKK